MDSHQSPQSSPPWRIDSFQGRFVLPLFGRNVSFPLYPLLLLLLHGIVFSVTFPLLDLPVADDANYFGSGKSFVLRGDGLYADWTPLVTYFSAGLYKFLHLGWYGRFAVYSFFCRLLLLWGVYAFTVRFTLDRRWAFFSTVVAAACFSYWTHMNGRAFASGLFFLQLAWLSPQRSLDLISAAVFVSLSFLLRPEFVLVSGGFALAAAWAQYRHASWIGLIRPTRVTAWLLVVGLALWAPICFQGKLSTQRLNFAFAQFFQSYVVEKDLLDRVGLKWSADWYRVTDAYFPPAERDSESILSKVIPLYEIASANPAMFAKFIAYNAEPFLQAEIIFSRSPVLSKLLNYYMVASFVFFLVSLKDSARRKERILYLVFSFFFIASVFPCLITRPFRDYLYAPLIWTFCVIPYFVWPSQRSRNGFWVFLLLLAIAVQIPGWMELIQENQSLRNWKRAQFIGEISASASMKNATLAECYPTFCAAFNDEIGRSVHYSLQWDDEGYLRAYGENGIRVDYVLLEALPPKHLLSKKKEILDWIHRWGENVSEKDGCQLWKARRRIPAPPGEIVVADDEFQENDLGGGIDEDPPDRKEIVIYWNFGEAFYSDYHIYVSVDGSEFFFLGRSGNGEARRFIWKSERKGLSPEFRSGPQFGRQYRFRVFGVSAEKAGGKPPALDSSGFVRYRSAPSIESHR